MHDIFASENNQSGPDSQQLQREWDRFLQNIHRLEKSNRYEMTTLFENAYRLTPKSLPNPVLLGEKPIPLTLMAISHGDEVGGIQVLSTFLEKLLLTTTSDHLTFPIQIIIGNPQAYAEQVRFIDQDLNRCFLYAPTKGQKRGTGPKGRHIEVARAKLIEEVLKETYFLLDLHQTQTPTQRPFMVLSHSPNSMKWAMTFRPPLSIVTSPKVKLVGTAKLKNITATTLVQENGGLAFTLEMGLKGLDPKQIDLGLHWVEQSIQSVKKLIDKKMNSFDCAKEISLEEIEQKWKDRIFQVVESMYCEQEQGDLDPGWENFRPTHKGQRIGLCGEKEIYAPVDAYMMFPKFKSGNTPVLKSPNDPICKFINPLNCEEIFTLLNSYPPPAPAPTPEVNTPEH